MKKKLISLFSVPFLILILLLASCASSDSSEDDESADSGNPIKNYVNQPKSRARDAKALVETGQNAVQEQADSLMEDDELEDDEE